MAKLWCLLAMENYMFRPKSPRDLGILHKTLIARKFSKRDDGRYRPKHVVFHC